MIAIYEVTDLSYINDLIKQYPHKAKGTLRWIREHAKKIYHAVCNGSRAGALWITSFEQDGQTYHMLEGYRDQSFQKCNQKLAFKTYKRAAEEVLLACPREYFPVHMSFKSEERYALLLARSLHFKYYGTDTEKGLQIWRLELNT